VVAGYHLVWTAYGWWLPNDPRGSWSQDVRVEKIEPLGEMHYGRKAKQPLPAELRRFYEEAADLLKHPLLTFSQDDFEIIAKAFSDVIEERGYTCYQCAIMPEHVHLLMRRHRDKAEVMIELLQNKSRELLIEAGIRSATHPVWGGPGWKGFLSTRADFYRVEEYIRRNPEKERLSGQCWPFVTPYDGWMPGYRG